MLQPLFVISLKKPDLFSYNTTFFCHLKFLTSFWTHDWIPLLSDHLYSLHFYYLPWYSLYGSCILCNLNEIAGSCFHTWHACYSCDWCPSNNLCMTKMIMNVVTAQVKFDEFAFHPILASTSIILINWVVSFCMKNDKMPLFHIGQCPTSIIECMLVSLW